jgi:hypothetical protein
VLSRDLIYLPLKVLRKPGFDVLLKADGLAIDRDALRKFVESAR